MSISRLSTAVIEELKKVFSIADKDGSGTVEISELGDLLVSLSHAPVSEEEARAILGLMDRNKDGTVDFNEFLSAMAEWLQDDNESLQPAKRQRVLSDAGRRRVHARVSHFFLQFRRGAEFDAVRRSFGAFKSELLQDFVAPEDIEMAELVDVPGLSGRTYTGAEKLEAARRLVTFNWATSAAALGAATPSEAVTIVEAMISALQCLHAYPSAEERNLLKQDLGAAFEVLYGALPVLTQLLRSPFPQLQQLILKLLVLTAPGPLIAALPPSSLLHASQLAFKRALVAHTAVDRAVELAASSPYAPVRLAAALLCGVLARDDPEHRDVLLQRGAVKAVAGQFAGVLHGPAVGREITADELDALRALTWTMVQLSADGEEAMMQLSADGEEAAAAAAAAPAAPAADRRRRHLSPAARWQETGAFLPVVGELILGYRLYNDSGCLVNVTQTLSNLLPGVEVSNHTQLVAGLLSLFTSSGSRRVVMALLLNVATLLVDRALMRALLAEGLLTHVARLLGDDDRTIRYAACKVAAVLAKQGQVSVLIEQRIAAHIAQLGVEDKYTRRVSIKFIKYCLMRGGMSDVRYLVNEHDVVGLLFAVMRFFRDFDSVLAQVYGYRGPVFDFEILHDACKGLNAILDALIMECEDKDLRPERLQPLLHAYLHHFTEQNLGVFLDLLKLLNNTPEETLKRWRFSSFDGMYIEARVLQLLDKLVLRLERAALLTPAYARLVEPTRHLRAQYQERQASLGVNGDGAGSSGAQATAATAAAAAVRRDAVLLRCQVDEVGVYLVEVPALLKLGQLLEWLRIHFAMPMLVCRETVEGTVLSLSSEELWGRVLGKWRAEGWSCVDLRLFTTPQQAAAAGADIPAHVLQRFGRTVLRHVTLDHIVSGGGAEAVGVSSGSPAPRGSAGGDGGAGAGAGGGAGGSVASPVPDGRTFQFSTGAVDMTAAADESAARSQLFADVVKNSHFGVSEVEGLFNTWRDTAPGGFISREQFGAGMRELGVTDPLVVEENFRAFDRDGDGRVSFPEYIAGLSVLMRGSDDERLALMFRAFDLDRSGHLTRDELFAVAKSAMYARGAKTDDERLWADVDALFRAIDSDGDQQLSFAEFREAVRADKLRIKWFFDVV